MQTDFQNEQMWEFPPSSSLPDQRNNTNYYTEPSYPQLPPAEEYEFDWQYKMRRSMQEIIPGLYLGPYASASVASLPIMQSTGLTHVVCVRQILERKVIRPNHPSHFKYLIVEVADREDENIISHLKMVNAFIDEALNQCGKVLVHGNTGTSRSPTFVIAYLMWKYGAPLQIARNFVQCKRFCINPNEGFHAQLLEYEPIVKAQHTVTPNFQLPASSVDNRGIKRVAEEEADENMDYRHYSQDMETND